MSFHDPRTSHEFTCVGCDFKRERTPNGPVFITTQYLVRRSDFERLLSGLDVLHPCYLSIDNKPPWAFMTGSVTYEALKAAFNRTQKAHTLGARAMEADWTL